MALPDDPVSGGYELSNSAGIHNYWSCPNCYADHFGSLEDQVINCKCGAHLKLTIDYEPVCRSQCVDPEEREDPDA